MKTTSSTPTLRTINFAAVPSHRGRRFFCLGVLSAPCPRFRLLDEFVQCNRSVDQAVFYSALRLYSLLPNQRVPMPTFRSGLVVLLFSLLAPLVQAQTSRTVDRSFDLASDGTVTLESYKGRIDVQTWDRAQVRVSVTIEGEKQKNVDDTRIRFESDADRLDIETDYDELEDDQKLFGLFRIGSIDRPSTSYTLTVPRRATLAVDTYSATTTVAGLEGELRFDAYSARLSVDRLTGPLRADTYSGDVTVGQAEGAIEADTYSGHLQADSLAGPVQFSTYSGSATLGFTTLADDCSFDSYSGDVTVTLPAGAGAIVETEEDALETNLPARLEQIGDDRIRATIGDGGPRLRFNTYSGALSVTGR